MRFPTVIFNLVAAILFAGQANAENPAGQWRVIFEIEKIGVLESVIEFSGDHEGAANSASSANTGVTISLEDGGQPAGIMQGMLATPFGQAEISVSRTDNSLNGIFHGDVNGKMTGTPFEGDFPLRDYGMVLQAIDNVTNAWLYDLRFTQTPEWKVFHDRLAEKAATAQDDFDMISGFQDAWGDGLFSHYELLRPLKSMDALLQQADERAEDKPIVRTSFTEDGIGIVVIDSFFGSKIEQQIDEAFKTVAERNPRALIIDVRENGGGTLSAWPVAARLVQEDVLVGYFISNRWWADHTELPSTDTLADTPSPEFVTPQAFQQDLFSDGLLVMRIKPFDKTYDGPVYALISERSRSATEALIGMLQSIDRVTVVGETSAGYMLNSNLFEIAEGFTLRVPVADFFLTNHQSLEGVGVIPDVETSPEEALDIALRRIRQVDGD